MRFRTTAALVQLTIFTVVTSLVPCTAFPQPPVTKKPAEESKDSDFAKINVQYAEVSLKLAEVELAILTDANQRLANTFPKTAVEKLRLAVDSAKARVENAKKGSVANEWDNYLMVAEADMKNADAEYRAAAEAVKRVPRAVAPLDLERLKLTAEAAQLRYQRIKAAKCQPDTVLVSWQLQDIREQLRRLSQRVELYRGNE